jgi:predicted nuclease with TOPRIM domain
MNFFILKYLLNNIANTKHIYPSKSQRMATHHNNSEINDLTRNNAKLNKVLEYIRRLEQERADLAEELIKTETAIIETENASLLARAAILANAGHGPTAPE